MDFVATQIQQAIDQIVALPGQFHAAATQLKGVHFGPFKISVSCKPSKDSSIGYLTSVDFTTTRAMLQKHIAALNDIVSEYRTATEEDVKALQVFSAEVAKRLDTVAGAVRKPDIREKNSVDSQLLAIGVFLRAGADNLRENNSRIADASHQVDVQLDGVKQVATVLSMDVAKGLQNLQNTIAGKPCGGKSAKKQFKACEVGVQKTVAQMQVVFAKLSQACRGASSAAGVILGSLSGFAMTWNSVCQRVQKARSEAEYTHALAQFDIDVALQQWHTLSDTVSKITMPGPDSVEVST